MKRAYVLPALYRTQHRPTRTEQGFQFQKDVIPVFVPDLSDGRFRALLVAYCAERIRPLPQCKQAFIPEPADSPSLVQALAHLADATRWDLEDWRVAAETIAEVRQLEAEAAAGNEPVAIAWLEARLRIPAGADLKTVDEEAVGFWQSPATQLATALDDTAADISVSELNARVRKHRAAMCGELRATADARTLGFIDTIAIELARQEIEAERRRGKPSHRVPSLGGRVAARDPDRTPSTRMFRFGAPTRAETRLERSRGRPPKAKVITNAEATHIADIAEVRERIEAALRGRSLSVKKLAEILAMRKKRVGEIVETLVAQNVLSRTGAGRASRVSLLPEIGSRKAPKTADP